MATTEMAAGLLPDREHTKQLRRAIIASTVGTAIEWYDFFLYGALTAIVFAKLYFVGSAFLRSSLKPAARCSNAIASTMNICRSSIAVQPRALSA